MRPLDPIKVPLVGRHLVEASAGTGKTYTITTLILRMLLEGGHGIDEILVVTYTRAATGELRDRVRRRIGEALRAIEQAQSGQPIADPTLRALFATRGEGGHGRLDTDRQRLRAALRRLDEAAIFTIHGFCQRALSEWAFESGLPFETELSEEPWAMLVDVVRDFWANHAYAASETQLSYWQSHDAGLEALLSVARRVTSNANLHLLPGQAPDRAPLDTGGFETARAEAAAVWRAERDEILRLLTSGDDLNRVSYKIETILGRWVPALEALDALRPGSGPDWLQRLSQPYMRARTKKGKRCPEHALFACCERLWEEDRRIAQGLGAEALSLRLSLSQEVTAALEREKRRHDVIGFDDLLSHLDAALCGEPGTRLAARLRGRYRAALIDEFQDTDPTQYRIFDRIYAAPEDGLFLIGDPKQAIYGFRGADVFAYLQAAADVGERRHTLATNYRSDPGLLSGIGALYARARAPFLFDAIDFVPVQPAPDARDALRGPGDDSPLQWLWLGPEQLGQTGPRLGKTDAEEALPRLVAGEIAALLDSGARVEDRPLQPRDIAVLCRTNKQARAAQAALRQVGLPAVLEGDDSVFDTETAEELTRVLAALCQPADQAALRAALVTAIMGVDAAELERLQGAEDAWDRWLSDMHAWSATWHARGLFPALHQLLAGAKVQRRLLALPDGERRLTDLLHLSELLHQAEREQHLGPLSLLGFLRTMRLDDTQRGAWTADSAQVRLESDAHAVQLTTVHKSKGLEYPVVYCPFLWPGGLLWGEDKRLPRFHDPDHGDRNSLDLGSDAVEAHRALAAHEALSEQLRLTYVALTRAKHRCYVVWGAMRGSEGSSLAYLLHQPPAMEAGAGGQAIAAATAARVKAMDADGLRSELATLAEASGGSVGLRSIATAAAPAWQPPAEPVELRCLESRRSFSHTYRVGSFSSLVSAAEAGAFAEGAPDHDGSDLPADAPVGAPPGGGAPATLAGPVALARFPAGARVGSMIHHVYEHIDFMGDDDAIEAQVHASLQQFGFEAALAPALCATVRDSLQVPIGPSPGGGGAVSGPRLQQVPRADRVDEMEFTLDVGHGTRALHPRELAALLRAHGAPGTDPGYAARLQALPATALTGFLRGYVDLLFRHGGRYYLVDYKSNRLGEDASDYAPARLRAPMAQHHYHLQYLLYVVAVHRHLQARLPGYRYERDFGGVGYLFVRGMSPAHPPGCGVFFERPQAALVQALAARIAGSDVAADVDVDASAGGGR